MYDCDRNVRGPRKDCHERRSAQSSLTLTGNSGSDLCVDAVGAETPRPARTAARIRT